MSRQSPRTGEGGGEVRLLELVALTAFIALLVSPFIYLMRPERHAKRLDSPPLQFVGSQKCGTCHQQALGKWQGSYHDLAMAEANAQTVLGDFADVVYRDPYSGVESRFFQKEEKYYVETEGPDGKPGIFAITHTFGAYPLQQYLVPFPGGRLQCLNIAWNSKDKQWYRLPPYEVKGPDDWLHWTRAGQTWNSMCAECHSTQLEKRFNITTNSYDTRWFEINVGCEACHGAGSRHVAWAEKPELARDSLGNFGLQVQTAGTNNVQQVAVCAPCHSRRFQLGDNNHTPGELLDTMVPSLIEDGLYYPDGQILDEVYVYGSFVQSKMYQHGVRCSDCHDVHSLKRYLDGNDLCLQCHKASDYDTPTHHFHKREHEGKPSQGYLCVKCHMPGRTYMGADYRPDHSLRIPRPDLTAKIGVPNSCMASSCHQDKDLAWINEKYTAWYGTARKPHYGEILAAGRQHLPDAEPLLVKLAQDTLQPVIVRSTALSLLSDYGAEKNTPIFTTALESPDALLRYTAIRNLLYLDPDAKKRLVEPKLYDRVKAVRKEAAMALTTLPPDMLRQENRQAFSEALAEYRQAMLYNSDFAPQRYNLGNLESAMGQDEKAIALYREAIAIDAAFFPAKVNLARVLNRKGENDEAVHLFREVIADHPELYNVQYSLGLLLAEMERYQEAATSLKHAVDGMPTFGRARYNYALVLLKLSQWPQAETQLLQCLAGEPANTSYFEALTQLYLNFGMKDRTRELANRFLQHSPGDPTAAKILEYVNTTQ
ncbi:tetratricopeptide repeat protein [Desulfopila aestuarii]|uniref:Tetratricopeptide repeat-containing protein n=1 Tax=Desulfopila aestuarii DSM 18488 TaxID=1121416 RepID=A0A1M7YFB1_9BACT|nr:tetratricopeptide repeat protein [Desulfopila aestuarii]SHO51276.1 Tetratricopeptide repeat-containing protein [Desulfopila aestuarii DSM 18488]